ncbi:MAG: hypothetical protein ACYC7J_05455 [Syntrophales bacterium]
MKVKAAILTVMMMTAVPALASTDAGTGGTSLLMFLFLGFGALIVACQLLPSLMLFYAMLKGLFHGAADTLPKNGTKAA